jgi:hypothetical protein
MTENFGKNLVDLSDRPFLDDLPPGFYPIPPGLLNGVPRSGWIAAILATRVATKEEFLRRLRLYRHQGKAHGNFAAVPAIEGNVGDTISVGIPGPTTNESRGVRDSLDGL